MNSHEEALDRLRILCMRLPEASEKNSWGHPNFRAGKRTFATFEWIEGRGSVAILLGSEEADRFLLDHQNSFSSPYGRGDWVSVWADGELDWKLLEQLIERAYRRVALKRMIAALENERGG